MWNIADLGIGHDGSPDAELSARELQRYVNMVSGRSVPVLAERQTHHAKKVICLGRLSSSHSRRLLGRHLQPVGDDGYVIQHCPQGDTDTLVLAGATRRSLLYATYHFIRLALNVRFYFDGEIVPTHKQSAIHVDGLHIREETPVPVRYWQPELIGDVSALHSPWSWDFPRWQRAIRWCVQNRLNGIEFTLLSHMNWGTDTSPQDDDDPYFTSEERIRLLKKVIAYTQEMGLKAFIDLCTAGTRLRHVGMHPEQAAVNTCYGSIYQGELCWEKGRPYLTKVLKQYIDLYNHVDGYVFQPDECQCSCPSCRTGKPFLRLFNEICAHIGKVDGRKSIYLWDWHIPNRKIIVPQLPKDVIIVNVHESQNIPEYMSAGLSVVYMPVINWNTASYSTISPYPHRLKEEMCNLLQNRVSGFEGHHVSMYSGECNAQAFALCAWDPAKFDADRFLRDYVGMSYGKDAVYAKVFQYLEKVWDFPFPYYFTNYMLDCYGRDYYDNGFVKGLTTGMFRKVSYRTVTKSGCDYVVKAYQAIEPNEFFRIVKQRIGYLKASAKLLENARVVTNKQRFLKASVLAQHHASRWCYHKYWSLMVFQQGRALRDRKAKRRLALDSKRHLIKGIHALNSLGKVVFSNSQWFQTRPCLALRDVDPWISTQGIRARWLRYYTSLISYPPLEPLASPKVLLNQINEYLLKLKGAKEGKEEVG